MYKIHWYLIIFIAAQSMPITAVGYVPFARTELNATLVKTIKAGLWLGLGAGAIQQWKLANKKLNHMRNNGYQAEADAAEYGIKDFFTLEPDRAGIVPLIPLVGIASVLEALNIYGSMVLGVSLITKKNPAPGAIVRFQHWTNIKLAVPLFALGAAGFFLSEKVRRAQDAYSRATRPIQQQAQNLGQNINQAPGAAIQAVDHNNNPIRPPLAPL